nr:AAA family ATPase [Pseudomonas chengduensis]
MSLRHAKFKDHWRHVIENDYSTNALNINTSNLLCIVDGLINVSSGICAIVGGNGVGKSALLSALYSTMSKPEHLQPYAQRTKVSGSKLVTKLKDRGTAKEITVFIDENGERTYSGDEFNSETYWIEPSLLVNQVQSAIRHDADFQSLLEPLTPYELSEEELNLVSYLIGKRISKCSIYEISEYGGMDPLPYFIVESGGINYNSENMGSGELSLLIIFWKLRLTSRNSALIIEEPETHVSPRSQRALMDVIAKFSDERKISVTLTTHSPAIISEIPPSNIILLSKIGNLTEAVEGINRCQINDLLGESSRFRGIILVEDKVGQQFLLCLLEKFRPDLARQFEIIDAKGYTNISSSLTTTPKSKDWFSLVGAFDGDMKERIDGGTFNWPFLFLPGTTCADDFLRNCLQKIDSIKLFCSILNKPMADVSIALQSVDGFDHHDWFTQLPSRIPCDHAALMRALVEVWLVENNDEAQGFLINLARLLE